MCHEPLWGLEKWLNLVLFLFPFFSFFIPYLFIEVNALIYLALKQETQKILAFLVGYGPRTLLINNKYIIVYSTLYDVPSVPFLKFNHVFFF